MNVFEKHEIFEIEVLQALKSGRLLDPLVFGGGTMLRLCHDLKRYSVDLDFWFIKKTPAEKYLKKLQSTLEKKYEVTDAWVKHYTILVEIRSSKYPKRLKIELRKNLSVCDYIETIAFSQYSTTQILLKTHTLEQTMQNKIEALLSRKEIRDGFDIECLLRKGVTLPALQAQQRNQLKTVIEGFTPKDFKVKLGSVLESDTRMYYIQNGFRYLQEKLAELPADTTKTM